MVSWVIRDLLGSLILTAMSEVKENRRREKRNRMRARGLDEKGLQEYYRNRNLLKARITGRHVANAVPFFVTRQTPITGATIPVDGGLPDATPR